MSEFAITFRRFLDEKGIFSRTQWAQILRVSAAEIEAWVTDEHFPSPETLRRFFRTIKETYDQRYINELESFIRKPLLEMGLSKALPGVTLRHIMVAPIRVAFLQVLDTLDPDDQEDVLFKASEIARARRDG
jgi:hypothetical protein